MSANTDSLESMCELVVDCPHSTPKWTDEGVVVLRNQNIKNGFLDLSSPSYTNQEDYEKRVKRAIPQPGDIVFTREAPMGEMCIIPKGLKCCLGQRQVLLRPKNEINGEYLFWALQSPFVQHQISWNEGTGSTVSNVRIPVLKSLRIPRHPNEEDTIAEILSNLSNKIELNHQTNQTLEQITQAIFKSWFVDFEPTRAKIAAKEDYLNRHSHTEPASAKAWGGSPESNAMDSRLRGNDGALSGNDDALKEHMERAAMAAISGKPVEELDALYENSPERYQQLKTTAALFPDALVESELGEVPEGWEVKTLEDILELAYGKALKKTDRIEGEFPVYGSGGLTGMHNKALVNGPGIIIGRKGTVGKLYWEDSSFYPIDTVFYVKTKRDMSFTYAYYLLQTLGLEHMNTDAAVPGLNRNNAYRLEVIKPSENLVSLFSEMIGNIRNQMSMNKKMSLSLEAIRDTLLPKLLSGELSVTPSPDLIKAHE